MLGACAWLKNEGLLIYGAAAAAAWLAGTRGRAWRAAAWGLLPAVPWRLYALAVGAPTPDFGVPAAFDLAWRHALAAAASLGRLAFVRPETYAGAWWLLPLGLLLMRGRVWGARETRVPAVFAVLLAAAYAGMYAFSAVPDFAWHLTAMERLLMAPSAVLLAALSGALALEGGGRPCASEDSPS